MRQSRPLYLILSAAVLVLTLALTTLPQPVSVFAQDGVPAADTPSPQPTEPPTDVPTTEPPTPEPTPTTEPEAPTATPTVTPEPPAPPAPVTIPEPITVVLFGTGLAALSAAAASRRKNDGKGDE
jgi:outer membrane biosynthesis protein TonB